MNYDIWGSWSSAVGPNAPLNDSCAMPSDQQGSAVSAVKAWTNAGMPANQIVLGVAAYGHSFSVNSSDAFVSGTKTLAAYPAFNKSNQPLGDAWDDTPSVDACNVTEAQGGTFRFWGLVEGGFLNTDGTTADGIYYRYDSCSQTVSIPLDEISLYSLKFTVSHTSTTKHPKSWFLTTTRSLSRPRANTSMTLAY